MQKILSYLALLRKHELVLKQIRPEAQNAFSFIFEPNSKITFRAGQHYMFFLPHPAQDNRRNFRIFSMSSSPTENYPMFTTRFWGEKSSSFKRALMNLKPGDRITARGPSPLTDYFVADDPDQTYIFLIDGIGITPFRSVLVNCRQKNQKLKGKLLYANSNDDIIFQDTIDEITKNMDTFSVNYIISPARIDPEMIKSSVEKIGKPIYILSGSPDFTSSMAKLLQKTGTKKKQVRAYRFKPLFGGGY